MNRAAIPAMILSVTAACSQVDANAPATQQDESLTLNQLRRLHATPIKPAALPFSCRARWSIGGDSKAYSGRGVTDGEARAAARIACTNANPGAANRLVCLGAPEGERWKCSADAE
jgi:hypothetical protein